MAGISALTTYAYPPLWFLGLHETLAGPLIDQLPRRALPGRILETERGPPQCTAATGGSFTISASWHWWLPGVLLVAVAACAWNSRRMPVPLSAGRTARSGLGVASTRVAQQWLVRSALAQAGFFFTLQSLWRSAPHRIAIATSVAVSVAT